MTHRHTSFLLRCWDLGGDSERIEIEHIQSGSKVLAKSVGAAIEWICERGDVEPARGGALTSMSAEMGSDPGERGGY